MSHFGAQDVLQTCRKGEQLRIGELGRHGAFAHHHQHGVEKGGRAPLLEPLEDEVLDELIALKPNLQCPESLALVPRVNPHRGILHASEPVRLDVALLLIEGQDEHAPACSALHLGDDGAEYRTKPEGELIEGDLGLREAIAFQQPAAGIEDQS